MTGSPYTTMFNQKREGVFQQELITYRRKGDMISKVTVTRKFYDNDDYVDSETVQPIYQITD